MKARPGFRRNSLSLQIALGIVVAALAIWGSTLIVRQVDEGHIAALERSMMLALRDPEDHGTPVGPRWLKQTAIDWTALGGIPVLSLVVAMGAGYLLVARRPRTAAYVLLATAGGVGLSFYLKTLYDRTRPDFLEHLASTSTSSFPSSHAMASSVVYLTLGTLLARAAPQQRIKIYFISCGALLTLAIGCTRVYLGVHYPTDVLAGWVFGMAWALACHIVLVGFQRRGLLRRDPDPRSSQQAP